jgi:hypothetical protein
MSRLRNHIGRRETERPQSINFPPCSTYLHRTGNKNQAGKETLSDGNSVVSLTAIDLEQKFWKYCISKKKS